MQDESRRLRIEPAALAECIGRVGRIVAAEPGAAAAWLHGSVVRGEPARDVDLAVLPRGGHDAWRVAERLAAALERDVPLGLPWDVRPVTSAVEPAFRYELLRGGVRVADNDPDETATFWVEAVRDYLDVEPMLRRTRRAFLERTADGS